jgi:hypothetical protein
VTLTASQDVLTVDVPLANSIESEVSEELNGLISIGLLIGDVNHDNRQNCNKQIINVGDYGHANKRTILAQL